MDFLSYLEVERRSSPRTIENYRHALITFAQEHTKGTSFCPWYSLTADDFRRHLFHFMKQEKSRATIRLHFAALRSFFKWLNHRRAWNHNPLLDVQIPKQEKKLPVVLTVTQIESMLSLPLTLPKDKQAPSWAPERDAAVLELFYSTGMRLSELASVDVPDLDTYSETLRVIGKGRKERLCPVGSHALRAIQHYRLWPTSLTSIGSIQVSRSTSPRTNSATASPLTFSITEPTSAVFSPSSVTPA
jgi:integrase/recombinase XerC